jgi:hypothetical protein
MTFTTRDASSVHDRLREDRRDLDGRVLADVVRAADQERKTHAATLHLLATFTISSARA